MGTVYLLGDSRKEGVYKIGVTMGKVENRIKKLQTGNSGEIYLVSFYQTDYPFVMEKMLHTKYFSNRALGEWFELSDEDVISFLDNCEKIQENINVLKENYFFNKKYNKKNIDYGKF